MTGSNGLREQRWARLIGLLAGLALVLFSANAFASIIGTSMARLDWSNIVPTNATPTLFNDVSTAIAGQGVTVVADDDVASGPTPPSTTAFALVGSTFALGETTETFLQETVNADAMGSGQAAAIASAVREVEFTADVTGLVTLEIPYEVDISVSVSEPAGFAFAEANLMLGLGRESENFDYALTMRNFSRDVFSGESETLDVSGKLYVDLFFEAGDLGILVASVGNIAAAAVPLPGSIVLLASGLAGLAGFHRRRKRSGRA